MKIAKIIIALNCLIYLIPFIISKNIDDLVQIPKYVGDSYGFTSSVLLTKEWWRFITSMFLHVSIPHLGFNMFAMHEISIVFKRFYKSQSAFFLIFLLGGIGGSVLELLIYDSTSNRVSVGASGGIMALVAALILPAIYNKLYSYSIRIVALICAQLLIFDALVPNINRAVHIGGTFTGLILSSAFGIMYINRRNNLE